MTTGYGLTPNASISRIDYARLWIGHELFLFISDDMRRAIAHSTAAIKKGR